MRESFSAKNFWSDVQRYNATAIIYIGELCRYLLNTPPTEAEKNNPVRARYFNCRGHANPTSTGSRLLWWLETISTGPVVGTFPLPENRKRKNTWLSA